MYYKRVLVFLMPLASVKSYWRTLPVNSPSEGVCSFFVTAGYKLKTDLYDAVKNPHMLSLLVWFVSIGTVVTRKGYHLRVHH